MRVTKAMKAKREGDKRGVMRPFLGYDATIAKSYGGKAQS